MTNVPIQLGENTIIQTARDPRAHAEGSDDHAQVRITLSLEVGSSGATLPGRYGQATNLVFRLNPWEAGRLRDELSKVLNDLGV